MQQKPEAQEQAQGGDAGVPTMKFPSELRKHFYDTTDWTAVIFQTVSLVVHVLFVSIIASRDWPDPTASLSKEQLKELQSKITRQFTVEVQDRETQELENLLEVSNDEFEQMMAQETAEIEASLSQSLQEAEAVMREVQQMSEGGASAGDLEGQMGDIQGELAQLMGEVGAGMDMSAEDLGGPALEIAATDVAIFADVQGATGSRVVAQAIDIGALGSNVQLSSSFTSGGVSAGEAARLTQQIQLARARLGSNIQIRVGGGGLGSNRRALLRVAGGGRTGRRIQVEQLALPPAQAETTGGRDQAAIDAVAARTRDIVAACYTIGLAEDPTLSGVVVVRFTINPDGSVSNVGVSQSNLGVPAVEECVVTAVRTWKFSPGSGTETFEYPFTFEPG